jgi:hypothetical protein
VCLLWGTNITLKYYTCISWFMYLTVMHFCVEECEALSSGRWLLAFRGSLLPPFSGVSSLNIVKMVIKQDTCLEMWTHTLAVNLVLHLKLVLHISWVFPHSCVTKFCLRLWHFWFLLLSDRNEQLLENVVKYTLLDAFRKIEKRDC